MPEEPKLETRAYKLADLIDYQAGSVVSRTLIKNLSVNNDTLSKDN